MLKFVSAVSLAFVAGISSSASAQQTNPPPAQQVKQPAQSSGHLNEVVCQKQEVTGSRLASKRVCKTRSEWADGKLEERQAIEKIQTQRGMPGN